MSNINTQEALLQAASLLEKAASCLEYGDSLRKEASSAAAEMVARGMLAQDQQQNYTEYLVENPEKIASMKSVFNDLPRHDHTEALGEASGGVLSPASLDAFDRACLGM